MAVVPEYQSKGIGKKLFNEGLQKAKEMRFKTVVVLGHPTYYLKFGFERASKWNLKLLFEEVPNETSMATELEEGFLSDKTGVIEYPTEYFAAL